MDIIYLVMCAEGEYDSYSNNPVKGYFDKEKAEQAIVVLQERDRRYNELATGFNDAMRQWNARNKAPETLPMLKQPIKLGVKKNTQEWRDLQTAQHAVRLENEKLSNKNHEITAQWHEEVARQGKLILEALGATEEELTQFHFPLWYAPITACSYDIEELEVE